MVLVLLALAASPGATSLGLLGPNGLAAQELYLAGGTLVDPEAGEARRQDLLIRDGMIVATPSAPPEDFAGEILDVTGRWVIPGLIDLHTHSFGNQAPGDGATEFMGVPGVAQRMLYAGVTAFLDLFSPEDQIFFVRNSQRENHSAGADIFAAGPCMTAPEGHCSEYGIPTRLMSTPQEARQQVRELAPKAPDVVKIVYSQFGRMPSVDQATMAAAVETAREFGIPTVIHVDAWDDVRDAAEAGASAVTHVPGDGVIPEDVLALMVERGVASIPTLAVQTGVSDFTANPEQLDSPLARAVASDAVREAYRADELPERIEAWRRRQVSERDDVFASVKRMQEAGIDVLTGTDSGNLGTLQGWSVHHELRQLVAAGLSPAEALAAGTTRAARFLSLEYGVTEGSLANLVVLEASPLESIANTETIVYVIHRGVVVERQAPIAK